MNVLIRVGINPPVVEDGAEPVEVGAPRELKMVREHGKFCKTHHLQVKVITGEEVLREKKIGGLVGIGNNGKDWVGLANALHIDWCWRQEPAKIS